MKTISRNEYLQLVGLQTLAANHNRQLREIEKAAYAITGEGDLSEDYLGGHTSDAMYDTDNISVDDLLRRLEITVEETE
ncbi:MAG: hypothetical protein KY468_11805 [Armatimonadetes bacterium]|nr:hypothetical protein [Armatimonadota bacterium]